MTDDDTTTSRKELSTDSDKIVISPEDVWVSANEVQIEMWDDWADSMGVSRSEFVRIAATAGIKSMDLPPQEESYDESSISYRRDVIDAVKAGASDADEVIEQVVDEKVEEIREAVGDELNKLLATGQLNYDGHEGLQTTDDQP